MRQPSPALFHGRHFDRPIIILCVRGRIPYKLSHRDLVEMIAERDVDVSHNAAVAIGGVELAQKIRKVQCDTSAVIMGEEASIRRVWEAMLAG